ncbi:Thioredoxin-like protein CXXS1 [Linum perenne]
MNSHSHNHRQQIKSKVQKVDSLKTWESSVSQASTPVIAHFTASWCMPSVAMIPLFEELSLAHMDAVFLSVDVDDVKDVAAKLEVKAMPTFVLMKDGAQADKVVGANPDEIRKRIDSFITSSSSSPAQVHAQA